MVTTTRLQQNLSVFNENKLLILKCLYECDDFLCGCDLVEKMDLPKNLISYHIGKLEELGYIEATRCGRNKNYQIAAKKRRKVQQILVLVELI